MTSFPSDNSFLFWVKNSRWFGYSSKKKKNSRWFEFQILVEEEFYELSGQ